MDFSFYYNNFLRPCGHWHHLFGVSTVRIIVECLSRKERITYCYVGGGRCLGGCVRLLC